MECKIYSRKFDREFTFSIPGTGYIFVDTNNQPGTLGEQICGGGHTNYGRTLSYNGEVKAAFELICRRWYDQFLKKQRNISGRTPVRRVTNTEENIMTPYAITPASKAATLTAMTGGEFIGDDGNAKTIEGWHCLTREFDWEKGVDEWIDAWRYMEYMTFWIADKDNEENLRGCFNEIEYLPSPKVNEAIWRPAHFTDEELSIIFEVVKASECSE